MAHSTRTKTKKRSKTLPVAHVVVATKSGKVGHQWSAVAVTYQQERVCCGRTRCGRCKGKLAVHGPYWYAYFRKWSGKKKSIYIGKKFRSLTNSEIDEAH